MVERFDFAENMREELSLLEYNRLLEILYVPNANESSECGGWKAAESGPYFDLPQRIVPVSESMRIFTQRYNDKVFPPFLSYTDYLGNAKIQKLVRDLSLDKEKFWCAVLFAYDYSVNQCQEAPKMKDSVEEQITSLQEKIQSYLQREDKLPFSFTLSTGKKKEDVVVDNDLALALISEALSDKMENLSEEDYYEMAHHDPSDETMTVPDCVLLTYFAKMFLTLFDLLPEVTSKRKKGARYSQKEKDLVCQLIYFAHLSRNRSWLALENENLKSYLRQYDREVKTFNKVYPIFNS